jgi:LuxR family maltose regulon positive regulatory protein
MALPILATKLFMPPLRAECVARPRLFEQLDTGLQRKLTLISAPAGFGKTSLLGAWLTTHDGSGSVAWLSLEPADGDIRRFLRYVIAALQTVNPAIGNNLLGSLEALQHPPVETILTLLINDLADLPRQIILVLDDYHLIDAAEVDHTLTFLLEHLPPHLHLVIATREDPRLPLARLRTRGELSELRATDLRFTADESKSFLQELMQLKLTERDVTLLESRIEGWVAGLQLAALSLQGHRDPAQFLASFSGSHHFVLDYLVDEVLGCQSAQRRQFLLQTAILTRLSGPLCDAVTGQENSHQLLRELERLNLFITPLDDARHWYRYHHLFAEALRAHLHTELPASVAELHQRASQWFEDAGFLAEAIDHALKAKDAWRVATLLEASAEALLLSRQDELLIHWVKQLPEGHIRQRPVLATFYALALTAHDLPSAAHWLHQAEAQLEHWPNGGVIITNEPALTAIRGVMAITHAYLAGARRNSATSVSYAQQALQELPATNLMWRGAANALLGLAYWADGTLESAYTVFSEGMLMLYQIGDVTQHLSGAFILANIRQAQGRLREAARIYQNAINLLGNTATVPVTATDLYVGLSEIVCEWGDTQAAIKHLETAKALSRLGSISEYRHRRHLAMARLLEAKGDLKGALSELDEAERSYISSPDPDVRPIAAQKARLWLRQGNLQDAQTWAQARGLTCQDNVSYLLEFDHLTLVRLHLAHYRRNPSLEILRAASDFLERLLQAAEAGQRAASIIEILVLQALVDAAKGDLSPAHARLLRAITIAEPESYFHVFVAEGQPLQALLTGLDVSSAPQRLRGYRTRLLAAFEGTRSQTPNAPELTEPLSSRELAVLRLIAEGLSNQEISKRLFRALSTIKGHNRTIFDKLQVKNRTEAVAKARELGLL